MLLCQFAPAGDDIAVILWRGCQSRAIIDAIVVEEDTKDFVSFLQRGLGEIIGRIRRLVLIRTFVNLNSELYVTYPLEANVC